MILDERQRSHRVAAARHLGDVNHYLGLYSEWLDPNDTPRDLTTQEILALGDKLLLAQKSLADAASELLTAAAISKALYETTP